MREGVDVKIDRRSTRQKYDGTPWVCRVSQPDEELLATLRAAAVLLGRSPSRKDMESLARARPRLAPDSTIYRRRYGSFNAAKAAAGLDVAPQLRPSPRTRKATGNQRFRILTRDGFRCRYCGHGPDDGAKLTIDHLTPFAKGGQTVDDNLLTACADCNGG